MDTLVQFKQLPIVPNSAIDVSLPNTVIPSCGHVSAATFIAVLANFLNFLSKKAGMPVHMVHLPNYIELTSSLKKFMSFSDNNDVSIKCLLEEKDNGTDITPCLNFYTCNIRVLFNFNSFGVQFCEKNTYRSYHYGDPEDVNALVNYIVCKSSSRVLHLNILPTIPEAI